MQRAIVAVMAIGTGTLIGLIDLTASEVQVAVGMLLFFGAILGFARPRYAVQSALFLGLMLPVVQLIASRHGFHWIDGTKADPGGAFIAMLPAALGVAAGVGLSGIGSNSVKSLPTQV